VYEAFDKVIITHGVRYVTELAYQHEIEALPQNEFFGEMVEGKLLYYPTVTREPFRHTGRLTHAMESGKITQDLGLSELDVENDRFMICGSPSMLKDTCAILNSMGFKEARGGDMGHYVVERAFVEQ
jgi:ferredoxin--NADP+ reductase